MEGGRTTGMVLATFLAPMDAYTDSTLLFSDWLYC